MSNMKYPVIEQTHQVQQLNDAIAAYVRQPRLKRSNVQVPVDTTFDDILADKLLLVQIIRAGIPFSLFDLIKVTTPFTEGDWANILDLSSKSLHRYKAENGFNFKPAHTEKILEMAELTKVGMGVFGTMDAFKLWLNTPSFALGEIGRMELLLDSFGKNLVLDELIRVEHGIFV
jgi:putative toxin-antitoxin system antitoxin component, TIGR02293 family